ncbi:hypothetical protein DENIS_0067 [Desulfonema ishimotonii]|uniref:LamG-like jellyroll fold domain-containing protein n=1 Tax=Desulfonema ishimotonii TaxID=45657 RepID=A0A401FQ84_9BACT|nr:LamG domain-containing protein [Desulfonema ishimotonii]GBC59131.1 hypothetical protein DENIS_0067 [Desulfonema ishimotonii]
MFITLIVTITIVSALGAAILSFTNTAIYSEINVSHFTRAQYLAESGMRYAQLRENPYSYFYTVIEGENGEFYRVSDLPPPASPGETVRTSGFRIVINNCQVESTGIVREGTPFEAMRTVTGVYLKGMPCWYFNHDVADYFEDRCGENNGIVNGISWEWRPCDPDRQGVLHFGGSDHADTGFAPFCEIGHGVPFTVAFWVKPDAGTGGTVLGISDAGSRFAVEISGEGEWVWAYGNKAVAAMSVSFDRWQHVTWMYDDGKMIFRVVGCTTPEQTQEYDYDGQAGSGMLPEPDGENRNLFIGAENRNGSPGLFFSGSVDNIEIYNEARDIEAFDGVCPGKEAVAYYPFDGTARDYSGADGSGNGNDGVIVGDAGPAEDRMGCMQGAYQFDGEGSHVHVADSDGLDLDTSGTLAAWVYVRSFQAGAGIVHKGDLSDFSDEVYTLQFGIDGFEDSKTRGIRFALRAADGGFDKLDSQGPDWAAERWYHVAVTWDSAGSKKMVLYIDGEENASGDMTISEVRKSDGGLNIGAQLTEAFNPTFGNFPLNGLLDEVVIYDHALSADEIRRLAL